MAQFIDVENSVEEFMWMNLIAFDGDQKTRANQTDLDRLYGKVFVDRWGRIHNPYWISVLEYEADIERLDTDYDAI